MYHDDDDDGYEARWYSGSDAAGVYEGGDFHGEIYNIYHSHNHCRARSQFNVYLRVYIMSLCTRTSLLRVSGRRRNARYETATARRVKVSRIYIHIYPPAVGRGVGGVIGLTARHRGHNAYIMARQSATGETCQNIGLPVGGISAGSVREFRVGRNNVYACIHGSRSCRAKIDYGHHYKGVFRRYVHVHRPRPAEVHAYIYIYLRVIIYFSRSVLLCVCVYVRPSGN